MSSKLDMLIHQLAKAIERFEAVLKEKKTDIVRDSAIQRFEFNFELVWKTMKTYLEEKKGIRIASPKDCIREAFKQGLIDDDIDWMDSVELRNQTVHTYNEKIAEEIYAKLPKLLKLYQNLLQKLKQETK